MTTDGVARARALLDLDRDAEARALLAGLVAQDPDDVQLLCLLAQACLGADDVAGTLAAAHNAVRLAPDDEWAHRLLSIAFARGNRFPEAVAAATEAVRLAPDEWRVHINRAHVDTLARRITPETFDSARRAVLLAPHEAETHAVLGSVLLQQRRTREAEQALREALRLDPAHYGARNDLARVDLRRHRLGRATRGFADAAAVASDDRAAAHNLHVALAQVLRRLHWVMAISVLAIGAAAEGHGSSARVTRLIFWLATVAGGVLVLASARIGSRARTRRIVGAVARGDRLLAGWAGCLGVCFAAVTVSAFAPRGPAGSAASVGWLAIIAGTVITWIRVRQRRTAG